MEDWKERQKYLLRPLCEKETAPEKGSLIFIEQNQFHCSKIHLSKVSINLF